LKRANKVIADLRLPIPLLGVSEAAGFNHDSDVSQGDDRQGAEPIEVDEGFLPVRDVATGQFRDHVGMSAELIIRDQFRQLRFESAFAEHFDPNRSVGENHRLSIRNLRTSFILGAVPASASSLRPASRAISDFKASRSNSARSLTPVYSCAVLSKSSSSDTVARITISCTKYSTA
jgi:hypothetical protein